MIDTRFVVVACAAGLASCSSAPKPSLPDVPTSAASAQAGDQTSDGAVLGSLGETALPNGQCGMLLWTTEESGGPPVLIFRYIAGGSAQAVVNGKPVELARIETSGATGFGVAEKQKFTSGSGLTVETSMRFGTAFNGGVWLQNGFVAAETSDGWRTIAPSAGIAGCRPK